MVAYCAMLEPHKVTCVADGLGSVEELTMA